MKQFKLTKEQASNWRRALIQKYNFNKYMVELAPHNEIERISSIVQDEIDIYESELKIKQKIRRRNLRIIDDKKIPNV